MGKGFYETSAGAKAIFEEANDALGFDLARLAFEGPESELALTANTQPAVLTASVAAATACAERGLRPALAAGHSLGEYTALVVAGALRFTDAVRLVRKRGEFMQEAVPVGTGAMAAIMGVELPAVERAVALATDRGGKMSVLLPVSAPFHCSLMAPAGTRLAPELDAARVAAPRLPVVRNVDAGVTRRAEDVRPFLLRQVASPVRWTDCVQRLAAEGATAFVEVGPGRVLSGLLRRILTGARGQSVEDPAGLEKALTAAAGAAESRS